MRRTLTGDRTPAAFLSREQLAGYDPKVVGRSTVLVVGAGALGQNTLISLALSGIGELRIVDHDRFEAHNSTRSPCYPTTAEQLEHGLEKARVVAHKIRRLMRHPTPRARYAVAKIQELGLGGFHGVDAVVSSVDNPRARAHLADACRMLRLPLIEGGFEGAAISLASYPPASRNTAAATPCWRCSHHDLDGVFSCQFSAHEANAQGVTPAIQAAAATLAGLQTEATIMALHRQYPLGGRVLDLNTRTGHSRITTLTTDPLCPGAHRTLPTKAIRLTTRPADTIGELLLEAEQLLGERTLIRLPSPYVRTAPCARCHAQVVAGLSLSQWATAPFCKQCSGDHARASGQTDVAGIAEVFVHLDRTLPPELLRRPCGALGIAAHDLLETAGTDKPTVLRVGGNISDLFEETAFA